MTDEPFRDDEQTAALRGHVDRQLAESLRHPEPVFVEFPPDMDSASAEDWLTAPPSMGHAPGSPERLVDAMARGWTPTEGGLAEAGWRHAGYLVGDIEMTRGKQ